MVSWTGPDRIPHIQAEALTSCASECDGVFNEVLKVRPSGWPLICRGQCSRKEKKVGHTHTKGRVGTGGTESSEP